MFLYSCKLYERKKLYFTFTFKQVSVFVYLSMFHIYMTYVQYSIYDQYVGFLLHVYIKLKLIIYVYIYINTFFCEFMKI